MVLCLVFLRICFVIIILCVHALPISRVYQLYDASPLLNVKLVSLIAVMTSQLVLYLNIVHAHFSFFQGSTC